MKIIVVGASHGGREAVRALTEMRSDDQVVWYDTASISPAVKQLFDGVTILDCHRVDSVDGSNHRLQVTDLKTKKSAVRSYDKLILCPGGAALVPSVKGSLLNGIQTMRSQDDIRMVKQLSDNAEIHNVVVVGAGYIGIGNAELFATHGKHVTLIDGGPRILHNYLDQEMTDILQQEMIDHGIELALGQTIKSFDGTGDQVTGVNTGTGHYLADLVVLSIGISPSTEWLEDSLELLPDGRISTDDHMQTSIPDVFAVGDATMSFNTAVQRAMPIALASNAMRQARIAVENLIKPVHKFSGIQGSSALRLFDYHFASTGINAAGARRLSIPVASVLVEQSVSLWDQTPVWFKLYYRTGSREICGAQIMSAVDLTADINAVSLAIEAHYTLDQLAYADFFFQPALTTEWNVMNMAAQKALLELS